MMIIQCSFFVCDTDLHFTAGMNDTSDELGDDAEYPPPHPGSFHCSMDDDDDDDDHQMPRILIVTQVPDAVFEEDQAQVIDYMIEFFKIIKHKYDYFHSLIELLIFGTVSQML